MKKKNFIEEPPIKGKDIIAYDNEGNKYFCFRCNCNSNDCESLRDSITGFELYVNKIINYEYLEN